MTISPTSETAAPDAFDPAVLRISQDFIGLAGVEKVLSVVPVRRRNDKNSCASIQARIIGW
jgi:hypothetical protein